MKYRYQLMWKDNQIDLHRELERYVTVDAHSAHEAMHIASYEHSLGLQWDVPILEIRIEKELEEVLEEHVSII